MEPVSNAPRAGRSRTVASAKRNLFRQGDRIAQFADCHPWTILPVLLILCIVALHRHESRLWFDELFTYYIAQAPTFKEMILWTHQIDLNPPLYYIAVRIVFHFIHPSALAARLPAVIAYFVAVLCVFQFTRFRLSPLYGLTAGLILLGSDYVLYAYEARPYAFILGFLGIAAVGWQKAISNDGKGRWLALLAVLVGGFGMLLSHVLALVAYGALFAAEFIRLLIRRKADIPLWICLLLPMSCCALYTPLFAQHSAGVYPPQLQASVQAAFADYSGMWIGVAPLLAGAVILIFFLDDSRPPLKGKLYTSTFTWPELTFLTCLLLVPLAIIVEFMRSHSQYFPRYGIPAIFAVAVLVPTFVSMWTANSRRAAALCAVVFLFAVIRPSSIARVIQAKVEPNHAAFPLDRESPVDISQIQSQLAFVDADGLTFLEMNHYENPEFLSRVYYLLDPKAAYRYAHANGFNGMGFLKTKFPIPANVEPYDTFIESHNKFLVLGEYDTPDDWLLSKLLADHAAIRFLGQFKSEYKDHDLYEVTVAPSATANKP